MSVFLEFSEGPQYIVSQKPHQLPRDPKGKKTNPETEYVVRAVALGHAQTYSDPALPRLLASSRGPGLASAGRPTGLPLCGAWQEVGVANDLFFWARGAIWS